MKTLTLITLAVLAAAPVGSAQQAKPSFDSQYGLLDSRNPFLRDRRKPRDAADLQRDRNRDRPRTRTAAQAYVLRGVAIEDDQFHAYLEDTRGGTVVRVSPGDTLGDGRVMDVAIDAMAYELAGHVQWVEVGQDLTGTKSSGSGGSAAPATDAATQPQGATPTPLPPGGGTLEERMKARRAQQRGTK